MKKIIAVISAGIAAFGISAGAEYITFDNAAGKQGAVAFYDEDNRLSAVKIYTFDENGGADIERVTENGRLFIEGEENAVIIPETAESTAAPTAGPTAEPTAEPTAAPTEEPTAVPTEAPTASPTTEPTAEPTLSPVYQNEADAMYTFAVVKDVAMVSEDDEAKTQLMLYYLGDEHVVTVGSDVSVTAQAPAMSAYDGMELSALAEGDVVTISASVSGEIRAVNLIMRMQDNPLLSGADYGTNFEDLFSLNNVVGGFNRNSVIRYGDDSRGEYYSYAFGCIFDKSNNLLTLYNSSGRYDECVELSLSENTNVYIYNNEEKEPLYIGYVADIQESDILPDNIDGDMNVIEWNDEDLYTYALARESAGIVTDIIVFENF